MLITSFFNIVHCTPLVRWKLWQNVKKRVSFEVVELPTNNSGSTGSSPATTTIQKFIICAFSFNGGTVEKKDSPQQNTKITFLLGRRKIYDPNIYILVYAYVYINSKRLDLLFNFFLSFRLAFVETTIFNH